jgi:cytidylate kinase
MGKQIIIALSRTYGSGGHEIGQLLADRLGIDLLDRELLEHMEKDGKVNAEKMEAYDEKPRNFLLSRTVRGLNQNHTNSPEEILAQKQFDYIRHKAASGQSFILVGRCGNEILRDYPDLVRIFIIGDKEARIQRIMRIRNMDRATAWVTIRRHDRSRRIYNNAHSEFKWGDPDSYDLMLSSTPLGSTQKCMEVLYDYLKFRGIVSGEEA